jgi:hypothetical protein
MVAVYTPDNERYWGREAVFRLDHVISRSLETQHRVGHWTRSHELTDLQAAASELIPPAISGSPAVSVGRSELQLS